MVVRMGMNKVDPMAEQMADLSVDGWVVMMVETEAVDWVWQMDMKRVVAMAVQ